MIATGIALIRAGWRHAWPAGWSERLALLSILAWAAALRFFFLREPIRFDEAASALYYSDRSLLHALGGMAGNANHGLASTSIWFAVRLLGWSEAAVRLPTLLCGVALCWVFYAGLRWYSGDGGTALSGAAVAAVSPWLVFFSVNARGYVWQTACAALLAFLVLAFLRGTTRLPAGALGLWAGALTAAGAFAVRSMLVPALGLFAGGALLATRQGVRREAVRFHLAWAASAAVLALAVYSVAAAANGFTGLIGHVEGLRQPRGVALAETAWAFTQAWPLLFGSLGGGAAWLAGAALAAGSLRAWRRLLPFAALAAAVLAAGLAVTAVVRVGLYPRVLLPLAALLVPALAVSGQGLPRAVRGVLVALLLTAYPALWLRQDLLRVRNSTGDIPEARVIAARLLARPDLGGSVLVLPPLVDVGVAFYLRQAGISRAGIHGYGLGLDPARHCDYRQVLVFVPEGEDPRVGEAPWSPRLVRSGRTAEPVPAAGGALVRIPMAPCP
ncbi:MAG TPA: hypothetical protein VF179_31280 [Thermoanaerobaculia bacterium]|nr:hypothetical protein [Thermoanaerobaculia bacterium]